MRLSFILLVLPALLLAYPKIPDFNRSPGHLCTTQDGDFSEYRYEEEIAYCARNVSKQLKRAIYDEYGIAPEERSSYTIDHIIPLSLGGSNRRSNLWPEHRKVKATRPDLEYDLFIDLREGQITQSEAVQQILNVKFNSFEDLPSSLTP